MKEVIQNIQKRANYLLENRSKFQVIAAQKMLGELYHALEVTFIGLHFDDCVYPDSEITHQMDDHLTSEGYSLVYRVWEALDDIQMTAYDGPDIKFHEYEFMAALSLSMTSLYIKQATDDPEFIDKYYGKVKNIDLSLATEAICIAEAIHRTEKNSVSLLEKEKQALSNNSKRASQVRHGPGNEIKDRFLEYCSNNDYPSVAEAARRFYKDLPSEDKVLLCPSRKERNAERTLTSHYSKNKHS